jgi:hypothetical protein
MTPTSQLDNIHLTGNDVSLQRFNYSPKRHSDLKASNQKTLNHSADDPSDFKTPSPYRTTNSDSIFMSAP